MLISGTTELAEIRGGVLVTTNLNLCYCQRPDCSLTFV